MPKKNPFQENKRLAAAALRLAAARGWDNVTSAAILKEAKLKKRALALRDIAGIVVDEATRQALAGRDVSGSPRDVLFDLMMTRFDVLQEHRKGVLAIAHAARHDRGLACVLARKVLAGMQATAAQARRAGVRMPQAVLGAGLSALYGYVFWVWSRDTSRDMAKTMAALDRILRRFPN